MSYIIDPKSVSFEDVKADLLRYADAKPDSTEWDVFFESSGGFQIIELIAALRAMLSYDTIIARRENHIQFAKNRSTKVGSAQFLGYSAFRGKNSVVKIKMTPRGTGVYQVYDIIGSVLELDLIVLEPVVFNAGVEVEFTCMVGEFGSEEKVAQTSGLGLFKFKNYGVSDEMKVFIDGLEVAHTDDVVEMLKGKAQVQSNAFGSVDVKYLNLSSFTTNFIAGSVIEVKYVKIKDLEFILSDIQLDEAEGVLVSVSIVSTYKERETDLSIEINAPLRNETKMNVRGRKDQEKVFRQLDPTIISAKGEDVTHAVMKLYYLKENDIRFTPDEKVIIQKNFEPYRPHGLLPPIIDEARRALRTLKFNIYRVPNTAGDIVTKVNEVVAQYENKLGWTLNLHDIEAELEAESYIKVARVEYVSENWQSENEYEYGQQVKVTPDNGFIYEIVEHIYMSDIGEPVWPIYAAIKIEDKDLIWKSYIKDDVSELVDWTASTVYGYGSRVRPTVVNGFAYKVVGFVNYSGPLEPTWPTLSGATVEEHTGNIVPDFNIIWRSRPLEGNPSAWVANKTYQGGEIIVPTDSLASDNVGIMYQAFSSARTSSNTMPNFPTVLDETVTDGSVRWQAKDPKQIETELPNSQYFSITKVVNQS